MPALRRACTRLLVHGWAVKCSRDKPRTPTAQQNRDGGPLSAFNRLSKGEEEAGEAKVWYVAHACRWAAGSRGLACSRSALNDKGESAREKHISARYIVTLTAAINDSATTSQWTTSQVAMASTKRKTRVALGIPAVLHDILCKC